MWRDRTLVLDEHRDPADPAPSPEAWAQATDLADAVRLAIDTVLTPHQRAVALAIIVEGCPAMCSPTGWAPPAMPCTRPFTTHAGGCGPNSARGDTSALGRGDRPMSMTLTDDQIAALLFDSEPWFSCEDCFEHIDVYVEQLAAGLDPGHRAMEVHLKDAPVRRGGRNPPCPADRARRATPAEF